MCSIAIIKYMDQGDLALTEPKSRPISDHNTGIQFEYVNFRQKSS
jgi:hypothetical protein